MTDRSDVKAVEWTPDGIRMLDQTLLPHEETYLLLTTCDEVARSIVEMKVRGAPAIGITSAYGLALGARGIEAATREEFLEQLGTLSEVLAATRPTAVNLFWALERMRNVAASVDEVEGIAAALEAEARRIDSEAEAAERILAANGAELIDDGSTVMTHCNTGALAAGGYGTALGMIRAAWESGKWVHVYACETRPRLQGARLTAWELARYGIPYTLITDTMTGHFLAGGTISAVVVGADRITSNGDVANKIGTYNLAILAGEHGVPFYVAAPTNTIDLSLASGREIPIEERDPEEVTHIGDVPVAPEGAAAANPAFDVTPARLVTAIVTERGVAREPYRDNIKAFFPE